MIIEQTNGRQHKMDKTKAAAPKALNPGQLFFSFSPTGGQGSVVIVDVATKEEAAQRIVDALQGKLFTPVALWGNPDPRLWIGRPLYVGLSLPDSWVPWLKEKFAAVDAHF